MTMGSDVGAAEICRWFASIFAWELSAENIDAYRAGAARPFLDALVDHGEVAQAAQAIASSVKAWGPDTAVTQRRLAADFAGLLILPGPDHVSPYASSYDEGGVLMGAPHDRMLAVLRESNLGVSPDVKEPADHLSVMLEYAAVLIAEDSARARAFVQVELLDWVNVFAKGVQSRARIDLFYRAAAACTSLYLRQMTQQDCTAPVS